MENKKVNKSAVLTAYLRGYHATHDVPKIFDDFLAYQFLTEEERLSLENGFLMYLKNIDPARAELFPDQATALAWIMQSWTPLALTVSRSRYTEDILEEAVRNGLKQYVVLGAGMDTFAFRRKELVERLQVFEVDHPATQDFKCRRLAELGQELPAQLHFVPTDFTQESLDEAFRSSPYDLQALTLFSWLGVSYYLTRDEVFATLRAIANVAPAGSMVIFDYLDTDAFVPEKASPFVLAMQQVGKQGGEPIKAGFDPTALAADLNSLGFRLIENLKPANIEERYFTGRQDDYHALKHFHYAYAVVE